MMVSKKIFLSLAAILILLMLSALSSAEDPLMGCCCCPGSQGIAKLDTSCDAACEFVENPDLSSLQICSCDCENTYTISGIVKRNNQGIQGATVSIGSESTTSGTGGVFMIANVCEGESVVLAQSSDGSCSKSTALSEPLADDISNFIINLDCTCVENTCYFDQNAYCQGGQLVTYDLTIASQNYSYCVQRCSEDEDCGSDSCVNNDGSCLAECSATPSAENYDSDCVCSSTQNGVCPVGCSESNDVDCKDFMSPSCGDGMVFYPYESCEDNPLEGQFSYCSKDSCDECNCDSLFGCGNFILEAGEACEIGMKCSDGSDCTACVCGGAGCSGVLATPFLSVNYSSQTKSTMLKWTLDAKCAPAVQSFDVYKCKKVVAADCTSKIIGFDLAVGGAQLTKDKFNFTDLVMQNTNYCYFVRASYRDSSIPDSDSLIKCQASGDDFCMDRPGDTSEHCIGNKRIKCKPDNNIQTLQDCSVNSSYCMGPDRDGITSCSALGVCDVCNGLFGSYSNLDLTVRVLESTGTTALKYCSPEVPGADLVAGCYLDHTRTLFDAFRYCANVASCYDYKSQDACLDSSDPCGKNKGCEWVWMSETELGGICRPANKLIQNCRLCDDPKYNWITPICTPATCSLFGENCNYQGLDFSSVSCSDTPTARCPQYTTEQACTGGTPVSVDAQYDANRTRISGTNALTHRSNDVLDLGKCYWDSTNVRCLRNADNLPVNFQQNTGFDCNTSTNFACEADFRDPVTTILPSGSGIYPADVRIKFTVSDNYPLAQINTYFCIDNKPCYPDRLADKGEYRELRSASGRFTVYYYSVDPAKNLEVIKNTTILVDVDPPIIELTDPADAESFPTNQQDVTVKGLVPTDARYVCANNTATKKTVCANNCALKQVINKIPCFSETTGEFTMTINIGNSTGINATRNIIFYSEDFAGNKYSNTLLGILYDIVPPSAPTIIIY